MHLLAQERLPLGFDVMSKTQSGPMAIHTGMAWKRTSSNASIHEDQQLDELRRKSRGLSFVQSVYGSREAREMAAL